MSKKSVKIVSKHFDNDDLDEPQDPDEEEEELESESESDSDTESEEEDEIGDETKKEYTNENEEEKDDESSIASSDDDISSDDDDEDEEEDDEEDEDAAGISSEPTDIKNNKLKNIVTKTKKAKLNSKKNSKKGDKHDSDDSFMNIGDDINIDDDEEEEEEDENDNYLQKFDESIRKNIITQYHPEIIVKSSVEIETLTRIVRDSNGNIIDPFHKTLPFLTKYEKARILGERANQINEGSPIFITVEPDIIDGYLIALKEFEQRKIPFIIQRPIPNGTSEYWRLSDLEII